MAAGVRLVSVRRGRDPRDYVLMPFGGAGGLHAALVADELGIRRILVPRAPGATSAEGLLRSDVRVDHVITDVQREDQLALGRLGDAWRELVERVSADLANEGFTGDRVRFSWFFDLRYSGQAYEIRVPIEVGGAGVDEPTARQAIADFHAAHQDQYGYSYQGEQPVELVNLGLTGIGVLTRPPASAAGAGASSTWDELRKGTRPVWSAQGNRFVECGIYDRPAGSVDAALAGPAVIEQYDSTLVVEEGWRVATNDIGQLSLERVER
jgi:N-methylhydantoinase A